MSELQKAGITDERFPRSRQRATPGARLRRVHSVSSVLVVDDERGSVRPRWREPLDTESEDGLTVCRSPNRVLALSRRCWQRWGTRVRRQPPPTALQVSTEPSLFPTFDASVSDYVVRCEPSNEVQVSVSTPQNARASVDGGPWRRVTSRRR